MITGRTVVDYGGVAVGVANEHGDVYDHGGVHIGTAAEDGTVRDFAGVRFGTVRAAPTPEPAGAVR